MADLASPNLPPSSVIVAGHRIVHGVHGEGPPVVLLHGTPSLSHLWREVMPHLMAAGRRVYFFDLLDYSSS